MKKRIVTVNSGDMTFAPISYNTFQVGSVSVQVELEDMDDVDEVVSKLQEKVRSYFAERYKQRLKFYVDALKHNAREVNKARESGNG